MQHGDVAFLGMFAIGDSPTGTNIDVSDGVSGILSLRLPVVFKMVPLWHAWWTRPERQLSFVCLFSPAIYSRWFTTHAHSIQCRTAPPLGCVG